MLSQSQDERYVELLLSFHSRSTLCQTVTLINKQIVRCQKSQRVKLTTPMESMITR